MTLWAAQPLDETSIEKLLPAAQKQLLPDLGTSFEASVNDAQQWETPQQRRR